MVLRFGTIVPNIFGCSHRIVRNVAAYNLENFDINVVHDRISENDDGHSHHQITDAQNEHRHYRTSATNSSLNNTHEARNEIVSESQSNNSNNVINHNNNNNAREVHLTNDEQQYINSEICALFKICKTYILFACILLAKVLYDYKAKIISLMIIVVTFTSANNSIKREIAKQNDKSWLSLSFITCYVVGCIIFIRYEYDIRIFSLYVQSLTIWELLWSVLIRDFILKLITILFKVFLTCLPSGFLTVRKRRKYFLLVEATSQLYRCIASIPPWLYYFLEAYQGSERIFGIILFLLYIVNKGIDLLPLIKFFLTAIQKLLSNMDLGVLPSRKQLAASSGICVICTCKYSNPIRLTCKHIFCETCILTWLNRRSSCPLCRTIIVNNFIYQDGHTSEFIQIP
ncbi:PREDICTED: RING finger and transmembrane domain-containing protein 2 [Eufriesea mexicana]|uniref:RING finger and transmembrane domain-containing protein 2 n=1 Tax=Eufriesea mexicana TaxID=516756 RepID=UPI00083C71A7|nr:PREDICTED: RING finger and transmembrane domain-containing protein 2 [Eufriesea mexicana]